MMAEPWLSMAPPRVELKDALMMEVVEDAVNGTGLSPLFTPRPPRSDKAAPPLLI